MLLLGAFVLIATASLGTTAYTTARDLIERSAVNEVGVAANARVQTLTQLLDQQQARAQALVRSASLVCAPDETRCLRRVLANFVAAEAAHAVRLVYPRRDPIVVGPSADIPVTWAVPTVQQGLPFKVDDDGRRYYVVSAGSVTRDGVVEITLQGDLRVVNGIFLDRSELGLSGESFLVNSTGFFITPPRYPVAPPNSSPVRSKALSACLAGTDGELVDVDYRGVPAVHAYRHVPRTGGCVVALIDQAEAFAPSNKLRRNVAGVSAALALLAVGCSFLLAQLVTRPIGRLRERARSLERGDFDSAVPMGGPAEVQTFAQTFAAMASSLKKSRTALQESTEQIRNILESIGDSFVAFDSEWRCTYINEKATSLGHIPREQVVGQNLRQLLLDRLSPSARGNLLRSMQQRVPVHFEEYYAPWDGWFEVDAYPTGDGLAIFGRDVTGRKVISERLQQTQKLESLGVLAGGIAHDFNNLLTGIMGNASLVLEELPADHPHRSSLENVVSAAERAALLTQQLLAYAGKGRFVIQRLDLSDLVRTITNLLHASIPRTVELRLDFRARFAAIEADSSQIQQLIMNLVINAAESIPDGQPGTVRVVTDFEDVDQSTLRQATFAANDIAPGKYVTLEVFDTGCGMDEEAIRRIFDPFYTTKFAGRGLGLAAATGIVRGHRGALKVLSTPGKGTSFKVILPAVEGASAVVQPALVDKSLRGSGTILVIDDEDSVRHAAQSILERYGYQVILAENGQAGINLFRGKIDEISLVLLDMTMPIMSGAETLERLRSVREQVPVILTSGYDETEAMSRFVGLKLAGFIQKPFTSTMLAQQVGAALAEARRATAP
ncbi:MAG: response regulator [Acidobacteriota bacterium]